uniref:Uncharacterized protein n=1 Tax=Octopus bimaculoides TaxID=37653 RepID=A0A0L8FYG6_OCTBM
MPECRNVLQHINKIKVVLALFSEYLFFIYMQPTYNHHITNQTMKTLIYQLKQHIQK